MKRLGLIFFVASLLLSANVGTASLTCYVCAGSSGCYLRSGCTVCKKTMEHGVITSASCDNSLNTCSTTSGGVTECFCYTDFCNNSSRITVSVSIPVLAVVAAYCFGQGQM